MADKKTQFKINKLAKDLGLKGKDLVDILAKHGKEVTVQRTLEEQEFDILLDTLTGENQIDDIVKYLDGETYIPSKKKPAKAETEKKAEKPAAEKTAEKEAVRSADTAKKSAEEPAKADGKAEPKAEEKKAAAKAGTARQKAETPAAEKAAEAKPAAKTAEKKAEAKPEVKAEPGTAVRAEVKAEVRTEAKANAGAEARPASGTGTAPQKVESQTRSDREAPRTDRPFDRRAADHGAARPASHENGGSRFSRETSGAGEGRPQNGSFRGQTYGQNPAHNGTQHPMGRTPMTAGRTNTGSNGGYQPRPQNGSYSPANGTHPQQNGYQRTGSYGQQNTGYGTRPMNGAPRTNTGSFQQGGSYGTRPAGGAGQRSYGNKPQNGRNGSQRFDRDKGDFIPGGPRDTFKAQPIVRGATTNVNPDGTLKGPRVVDTRGASSVDLSKYDERLESFATDKENNLRGGNQRVKKSSAQQPSRQNGKSAYNKGGKKGRHQNLPAQAPVVIRPTTIELPDEIVVGQLASRLMVTAGEVVKKLVMMGLMVTVNQVIEYDYAALVAEEFGVTATHEVVVSIEEKLFDDTEDSEEELVPRAPVVCVMGHVDHGKTSILDAIRNSHVTAGEAGGITQHIGAYRVKIKGRDITFLDTPGHEAFTAMRARGAMATDIAILVVAADDGIMPQTVEAINHAKAAGIEIVVAINKMDKPGANPDGIKQELTKYDLVPEEWGGDVICVPVSALKRQGIDDLLESVLLVADMKELKANPNRRAKGIVIEAKLDKGRGPVATVLVQNGTLHSGDIIIAGTAVGHVRSMMNYAGKQLKEAGPSVPVEITGLAEVPMSGDEFQAVEDERMARTLADQRRDQVKEENFKANARASLNDLFAQISEGVKTLNIIVKADVGGTVEAVKQSLEKLSNEEVKVHVIHAAAGGITEGDVTFAAASDAIIVGFNVRPDKMALDSAERQNVEIRTYRVIYECIEEIEAAMKGMLAPKFKEVLQGHAEVRQTIHVPNVGTIAGSYVQDGKITRQSQIRVLRDSVVIFEDKISSLKRFKDDVKDVNAGYECGIGLEKFNDIKVGDVLEAFTMEQIQPE